MNVRSFSALLFASLASSACCADKPQAERDRLQALHDRETAEARAHSDRREAGLRDELASCTLALETSRDAPKLGVTYKIAIGDRVVLIGSRTIFDGVRRWRAGDDCRIDPDGKMTLLGSRLVGEDADTWVEYLARYARPPVGADTYVRPQDDMRPYACPDGALFHHEDPLGIADPIP